MLDLETKNMKKIIVLGAGLVGKEMAIDLSGKFDVTAVDINGDALDRISRQGIKTQCVDFTNEERLKKYCSRSRFSGWSSSWIFRFPDGEACNRVGQKYG